MIYLIIFVKNAKSAKYDKYAIYVTFDKVKFARLYWG